MPGLHHPVIWPLGGDGEAVELARQADGEVADVDHLLHFAESLGDNLPRLEADEAGQRLLPFAQHLAEQADELASPGRGDGAPREEGVMGPAERRLCLLEARRSTHNGRAAWRERGGTAEEVQGGPG